MVAIVAVVIVVGAVFYWKIQQGRAGLSFQPPEQRRLVEGLQLETQEGATSLEEFRGKIVLVDVWASWCGPCLQAVPKLIELQSRHAPDLAVVALNVDQEGWEAVERFQKRFTEINYLIVRPVPEPLIVNTIVNLDPLGQVSVLPTAFLLDRKGGLVGKYTGVREAEQIPTDIRRLMQELP